MPGNVVSRIITCPLGSTRGFTMRFTIRDVLWLMAVVAMGTAWGADRCRQNARAQALQSIVEVKSISAFPRGWEGITAAFRNENELLRIRIESLTHELESRGHRVEFVDCGRVIVDRPFSQPLFPPANGQVPPPKGKSNVD